MVITTPAGEKLSIDYPNEMPEDPTLKYKDYISHVPGPNFRK